MNEYAKQIVDWVMQGVASVGGIGAVIAIITTIIKTFGSNGIKAKLATNEAKLDKTLENGINSLEERINTDITVNISAQVNDAVERETRALRDAVAGLMNNMNIVRDGLATVLDYEAERNKRLKQDAAYLIEQSAKMRDITPVEVIQPSVAHITIAPESEPTKEELNKRNKVVI